jgi:hypothetical protein
LLFDGHAPWRDPLFCLGHADNDAESMKSATSLASEDPVWSRAILRL